MFQSPVLKWLNAFHPQHFFTALAEIDEQSLQDRQSILPKQRILLTVLMTALCLLIVNYMKYTSFFMGMVEQIALWSDVSPKKWILELRRDPFFELYLHAWWGFIHIIGYFLLPVLFIKFYLKERIVDHGLQLGTVVSHFKWYVLLALPILCFVVIVSFREDFSTHYPFYSKANRSWVDFLLWEAIYISQFIVLEFFFRGFILNSLKPAFGSMSIYVMCLPYLMIHFPKPWLEATGAVFFGLFLGALAMHSRSIWGGVGVHLSIALGMDIAALLQTRGLPQQWFPT